MDFERETKLHNIRVIISEFFMVVAVIVIVTALVLVASGYWVNSNLEVERNGLLQVSSIPTGADFSIDGDSSLFQKTNTSKMLASGKHEISITKEGYDSWSKTVEIRDGLLYRLHYPRLFLQDRVVEKKNDISGATKISIPGTHNYALIMNSTTEWDFINLDSEKLESKKVNVSDVFSSVSIASNAEVGLFTGNIVSAKWNADNNRILFKICRLEKCEWVLLNVPNTKNSINLTDLFEINFDEVKMLDNSANTLLAVKDGKLRKINVSDSSISGILAEGVKHFDYYDGEIAYISCGKESKCGLYSLRMNNDSPDRVLDVDSDAKVFLSKFYDDKYITVISGDEILIYKKGSYDVAKFDNRLSFIPSDIKMGHNGEFVIVKSDRNIATFDMESELLTEWSIDGDTYGWIDNDMIYSVSNGDLIVYDFDGLNKRTIAKNVSDHFPVAITNDKWLYYISDGILIREWLISH